ncbi:MAG TPA: hypothetical protein VKV18_11465 [Chthonomonas sp.]|uniref:hypothetical protein n=1 Tax=Chthonomonas sp. TaxID=2282153 RepID=UPI002B4AD315|nr:hypothetical protein [Chthonomonas sp.]HLI49290.1 hypothetical protein [Chthonomonas sp.]
MERIAQTTFRKRKSYLGVWLCVILLTFVAGAVTFSVLAHSFNDPNTLLRKARRLTPIHPENGEIYVWKSSHQAVILVSRAANPGNAALPIRLYDTQSHQTILLPQNSVLFDPSLDTALARTAVQAADEQAHLLLYQSLGNWLPNNVQLNFGALRITIRASVSPALKAPTPPGTTLIGCITDTSQPDVYLTTQPLPPPPFLMWLKRMIPKLPMPQNTLVVLWMDTRQNGQLLKLGQLVVNKLPPKGKLLSGRTDPLDLREVPDANAVSFVYNGWLYYLPLPTNPQHTTQQ